MASSTSSVQPRAMEHAPPLSVWPRTRAPQPPGVAAGFPPHHSKAQIRSRRKGHPSRNYSEDSGQFSGSGSSPRCHRGETSFGVRRPGREARRWAPWRGVRGGQRRAGRLARRGVAAGAAACPQGRAGPKVRPPRSAGAGGGAAGRRRGQRCARFAAGAAR